MKKKRKLLTGLKRVITGILCGAVIATSTFSSYSMTTYAANTSATSKLDQFANKSWIYAIRNGSYSVGATIGAIAGGGIGTVVAPGAGTAGFAGAGATTLVNPLAIICHLRNFRSRRDGSCPLYTQEDVFLPRLYT